MIPSCKSWKTSETSTPTAPSPLPYLPHEIFFFNILNRLPAKHLFRFRCVSKLWLDTIGSLEFASSHLIHSKQNPLLLALFHVLEKKCLRSGNYYSFISYGLPEINEDSKEDYFSFCTARDTSIIGSSNGLFCIRSTSRFCICNLTTHEVLSHPLPKPSLKPLPPEDVRLISYGFGFDPSKNEYKLVQIYHGMKCMVFTLGTNSWRDITLSSNVASICLNRYTPIGILSKRGVYANRAINWFFRPSNVIISFDINYENFSLIQGPDLLLDLRCRSLFESQGSLGLVYQKKAGTCVFIYRLPYEHHRNNQIKNHKDYWEQTNIYPPVRPLSTVSVTSISGQLITSWFNASWFCEGLSIFNPYSREIRKAKISLSRECSIRDSGLIYHVENILSLKTLVPIGSSQVKYLKAKNLKSGGEQFNQIHQCDNTYRR